MRDSTPVRSTSPADSSERGTVVQHIRNRDVWIVGCLVIILAGLHLTVDIIGSSALLPSGIPVGLLLIPVSYATVRFGLRGAVWTSLISTLLWLPDLLLSEDRGHPGNDLIELGVVLGMAIFIGLLIDRERHEHVLTLTAEEQYRSLVDEAPLPILLVDATEHIVTANPQARKTFPRECLSGLLDKALGSSLSTLIAVPHLQLPTAEGLRTYRVMISRVPGTPGDVGMPSTELFFTDITEHLEREALMAELLTAQEEERRAVAMDLHDDPLQLLIAVHQLLEVENSAADFEQLRTHCTEADDHVLAVIAALRATITGLRPAGLEQLGLGPALEELVRTRSVSGGPSGTFTVEGTPHRSSYMEDLHLYRIVQEAVSNIIRHSHASHFAVHLAYTGASTRVTISDDGSGFARQNPAPGPHHGISGMEERARLIGGKLHIEDTRTGTTVMCTVPTDHKNTQPSSLSLQPGSPQH